MNTYYYILFVYLHILLSLHAFICTHFTYTDLCTLYSLYIHIIIYLFISQLKIFPRYIIKEAKMEIKSFMV